MADPCVRLKVLLRQRHWQNHRTFCAEYDKAAQAIDPRLTGTGPSRAQLHRWLAGELKSLPYGDHCRILEKMLPGWTASQLFEVIDATEAQAGSIEMPLDTDELAGSSTRLIMSGTELMSALSQVVQKAQRYLVAVGSRSREPGYLQEIESAIFARPQLVHYRILIGPPHSQVLKDHLLRLIDICDKRTEQSKRRALHVSMLPDISQHHERFFVANESDAIVLLPSANSPGNFDTALAIRDHPYVNSLIQHGKALYGKHRLESADAVNALDVLG